MSETSDKPKNPSKRPRASAVLTDRRVGELLRIRLDGAEWWDVCEYAREKEKEEGSAWHVAPDASPMSDSQIRRLLAKADGAIEASHMRSRRRLLRRHMAQRRNLYAKALLAGDVRTALAVLKDEAEMLGLYPAKKVKNEITGKDWNKPAEVEVSDEELVDALHRLNAYAVARGYADETPPTGCAGGRPA